MAAAAADGGGGGLQLWAHQVEAVDAVCAQIAGGGRATVVMACGTGKTAVAAAVSTRVARTGRVLILVPTVALLVQTVHAMHQWLPPGGRLMGICMRRGVGDGDWTTPEDLDDLDVLVSTDPAVLAAQAATTGRVTVVATYASLPAVVAAHADHGLPAWDLLVADEAHRTAGHADRSWAVVHDDARVPAARRLYATATPRIVGDTESPVASMDDVATYGPEVYRLPFATAIDARLLADYQLVVVVVTDAEIAKLTEADAVVTPGGGRAVPARMLAAQVALLRAVREHHLTRVLTYHARVLSARRFAQTLPDAIDLLAVADRPTGPVHADSISADMTAVARRRVLASLEHPPGTAVVSNCRVLTEGVDVQALDGVMFADPRDSATDVVQAVGRALRRGGDGTKLATVIVPVLASIGENADAAAGGSAWDTVWRVVRALRAHDERLAQELDRAMIRVRRSVPDLESLPSWLRVVGEDIPDGFAAAVHLRIIEAATSTWLDGYARLEQYAIEHGHANPPADQLEPDGYPVGRWLVTQRTTARRGALAADRVQLLTDLGVEWEPDRAAWATGLAAAQAWHAEYGHLDVPQRYRTPDGYGLGHWLTRQRQARAGTVRAGLTAEQIAALDDLGMVWDHRSQAWQEWLTRMRGYRDAHGHANVPREYVTSDGHQLGGWLSARRNAHRAGRLPSEQAEALEALGVIWEPNEAAWEEGRARLAAYIAEHGTARVPAMFVTTDGYRLGRWVSKQRSDHAGAGRGALSPQRVAALDALGMHWRGPIFRR